MIDDIERVTELSITWSPFSDNGHVIKISGLTHRHVLVWDFPVNDVSGTMPTGYVTEPKPHVQSVGIGCE